ncbi:hypothetical protein MP638_000582 [Amoeboaphelidium occidentale]|nr:hypothetical protein MP638_000582 [Amoeboaphelidium occidentale]
MPPKKRKVDNGTGTEPQFVCALKQKANLVIMNYVFLSMRNIPCTFERLRAMLTGSSIDLTVNDLALMKLISPLLIDLRYGHAEDTDGDILQSYYGAGGADNGNNADSTQQVDDEVLIIKLNIDLLMPLQPKGNSIKKMNSIIAEIVRAFNAECSRFYSSRTSDNGEFDSNKVSEEAELLLPKKKPKPDTKSFQAKENVSVDKIIESLETDASYKNQIASRKLFNKKEPNYGSFDTEKISKDLIDGLKSAFDISIDRLYSHQSEAIDFIINDKKSVVVSTSTSSGKSLIFNIPVLNEILNNGSDCTAVYIYPTKALAQDQKAKLRLFLDCCGLQHIKVDTYDGDTSFESRGNIRSSTHIILTNPDMLHVAVLPDHSKWKEFLKRLKFVIIDELHLYSGSFGSHVGMVLRRLRRVCSFYGKNQPLFVCCSATISNPSQHASNIIGIPEFDLKVVSVDGSPCGAKDIVLWDSVKGQEGSLPSCVNLFLHFVRNKIRTILFCKYRKICEVVTKEILSAIAKESSLSWLKGKIKPYRGGYNAKRRREIEKSLFSGSLIGVISTSALEVGIDIGDLEATLHLGVPFSKSSFWQQVGRAGRKANHSVAVWISEENPMDNYVVNNPDYLYSKAFDHALAKPLDPPVINQQLQCAAVERMIQIPDDEKWFGKEIKNVCKESLQFMGDGHYYCHAQFLPRPSAMFPIRLIEDDTIQVKDSTGNIIEEVEKFRALFTLHEGAVYYNEAESYLVTFVDFVREKVAYVRKAKVNYMTKIRDYIDVDCIEQKSFSRLSCNKEIVVRFGSIRVTKNVYGYYKLDPKTRKILETVESKLETVSQNTVGVWLEIPISWAADFASKSLDLDSAVHSVNHLIQSVAPTVSMCSVEDLGTEHKSQYQTRERPFQLVIYDRTGGASESVISLFEEFEELLNNALTTVMKCNCRSGCPSCVIDPKCSQFNDLICKLSCKSLLFALLKVDPKTA